MRRLGLLLFCLALYAVPAAAQSDYPKNEFFVGYSYQRHLDSGQPHPQGVEASYTRNIHRYVGIKGDFTALFQRDSETFAGAPSLFFKSGIDRYTFLGGVEIKDNASRKRVRPFAHALVGGGRLRYVSSCSLCLPVSSNFSSGFAALEVGGGVDVKLTSRISLRAIQAGYNHTYHNRANLDNGVRLSTGIVFR